MKAIFLLALCFALAVAARASEGTEGHGGDILSSTESTRWFQNDERTISVCIEKDSSFKSHSLQDLTELVNEEMLRWKNYLEARNFENFWHPKQRITKGFQIEPSCQNADLKFYFGVSNPQIEQEKKHFESPMAFTKQVSASGDTMNWWSKGFVWVQSEDKIISEKPFSWNKNGYDRLHTIVSHEIGHIYGNRHVPGTIMRADVANAIIADEQWDGSIDQEKELYHIDDSTSDHNYETNISINSEAFSTLSGMIGEQIPSDEYTLIFVEPARAYLDDNHANRTLKLVSRSNPSKIYAELTVNVDSTSIFRVGESELFRGGHIGDESYCFGAVTYGQVRNVNLVIEYNMNTKSDFQIGKKDYVRIFALQNGSRVLLGGFEY